MVDISSQPIENMSFEKALEELESIVKSLESGKAPLDDSIKAYERGTALKSFCEKKLTEARMKIDKISMGADGTPRLETFES